MSLPIAIWLILSISFEKYLAKAESDSVKPTFNDTTGEYYVFENTSHQLSNLSCYNPNGCYIYCNGAQSCLGMTIDVQDTDNFQLSCTNESSCSEIEVYTGPNVQNIEIWCVSSNFGPCTESTFTFDDAESLNIICNMTSFAGVSSNGACFQMEVTTNNVRVNFN